MDLTLSIKDNLLLDDRLKPQEVYLFMHLVRLCDRKTGELNISALELMEQTRFTNKSLMLGYIKKLIECNYVERLENNAWLYLSQYYWTMISPNYSGSNIYGLYPDHQLHMQMVYDGTNDISGGLVRPVINVNKKVLSKTNIY